MSAILQEMGLLDHRGLFSRPRIVMCGPQPAGELTQALSRRVEVTLVNGASMRDILRVIRQASAALADGFEAVHLNGASLAVAGLWLRRAHHVPVSIALSAREIDRGSLWASKRLDHAFVGDLAAANALRRRAPRLAVSIVPPMAPTAVEPSAAALHRFVKLVHDVMPGRLVIGVPWPADAEHVRWYRDAVAPLLLGNPVCVLIGAPGRRAARLLIGAIGVRKNFRVHVGRIDGDTLAAAARICDLFVVPGESRNASTSELMLSLVGTQVPVVAGGGVQTDVIEHEQSAFVVPPGDAFGLVSTLNQALALPAVQRHYMGQDFAEHVRQRWSAEPLANAYAERFAVLVGRPQIPVQLRAA